MVFQLFDWDPDTLELYKSHLRPIFMEETNNNVEQTEHILDYVLAPLSTIGLVNNIGEAKPAWYEFIIHLESGQ